MRVDARRFTAKMGVRQKRKTHGLGLRLGSTARRKPREAFPKRCSTLARSSIRLIRRLPISRRNPH